MAHTKEVDLIHMEIEQGANDSLADALRKLEVLINAELAEEPDRVVGCVSVFQFNDGGGGRTYLLVALSLEQGEHKKDKKDKDK